jgi:hypothetical protein
MFERIEKGGDPTRPLAAMVLRPTTIRTEPGLPPSTGQVGAASGAQTIRRNRMFGFWRAIRDA